MPVLRRNIWIPIPFTLVVDHFGVGFVRRDHSDHLMSVLKMFYKEITTYWEGNLYCRITTKLYYSKRYVGISIPGYFNDALHQLNHQKNLTIQSISHIQHQKVHIVQMTKK